jgi:hypothetical protein
MMMESTSNESKQKEDDPCDDWSKTPVPQKEEKD